MSEMRKCKMITAAAAAEAARAGTASTVSAAAAAPRGTPDPEVRAVAKRRPFSAAYKLPVLEQADRYTNPGAVGHCRARKGCTAHIWRDVAA
jgi:hypothetical protein